MSKSKSELEQDLRVMGIIYKAVHAGVSLLEDWNENKRLKVAISDVINQVCRESGYGDYFDDKLPNYEPDPIGLGD